jgi:hypothetical protein
MMANSARDPYWQAAVRREVMDHPESQAAIEDTCSTCHMPMARFHSANNGGVGEVFANLESGSHLAMDGVSCTVCHQIRDDNFGEASSFAGRFVIDTAAVLGERQVFGPHEIDSGRQAVMLSAGEFLPSEGIHLQQSELCATCHTLITKALNDAGEQVGELAEQAPYLEWLHSDYRDTQSCQDCHMPELTDDAPISSVLGQPRPAFSQHVFRGGNAFMLGILNKYRGELGVTALPQELDASIRRTKQFLGTETARVVIDGAEIVGSILELDVTVESLAGHKLPSAYPSRRVWLHVRVNDENGNVLFESGRLNSDGSIAGNDNDADATQFEPHYTLVERPDQVQIYEPILADWQDRITTGLLYGVRYAKDNRILPRGFDKLSASWEVAVNGGALEDRDFIGGSDQIRYAVAIGDSDGPLTITTELMFQTVGYRWAENLRAYDAEEPQRFVRYYEENAGNSAVMLASASITAR